MEAPRVNYNILTPMGTKLNANTELMLTRIYAALIRKITQNAAIIAYETKSSKREVSINPKDFTIASQLLLGQQLFKYFDSFRTPLSSEYNKVTISFIKSALEDSFIPIKLVRSNQIVSNMSKIAAFVISEIFYELSSQTFKKNTVDASDLAKIIVTDEYLNQALSGAGFNAIKYVGSDAQIVRSVKSMFV